MAFEEFKNLFIEELREIFSAEMQLMEVFPKIIEAADSQKLIQAFTTQLEETKGQTERLKTIFYTLQVDLGGERCEAMEGLINECHKVIGRYPKSQVRDADLIMRIQCIAHYDIAVYGTLRNFAIQLEMDEAADLFQESLNEKESEDSVLTGIAEGGFFTAGINVRAVK